MASTRKNYSNDAANVPDLPLYEGYNLCQTNTPLPDGPGGKEGIDLWPGDDDTTVREFRECNLINVKIRPGYIIGPFCNTAIIEYEKVDAADQDEVELPGGEELRTELPHNLVHGKYEQGGTVDYKPTPERIDRQRRRR